MRAGLAFFVGAWSGWIVAAAVSVYGLDHLVRPYNASASFMIMASTSVLPSLAIGVAALFGARGTPIPWRTLGLPAMTMGLMSALVYVAAQAVGATSTAATAAGMVFVWLVLPAAAAFWARRIGEAMPKSQ
jgi:hypothetical protein